MKLSPLLLAAGAIAAPTLEKRQGVAPGTVVYSCTTPGVVAMTFDDGPFAYTAQALDLLDAAGFKATFFVNGENWGQIGDYASVVQRMYSSGHMIGSHTWKHVDLTTVDNAGIDEQMYLVENALVSMIGVRPLWVRLPYLGINANVIAELTRLGYAIADIDFDSKDYLHQADPQTGVNNFIAGLDAGGTIALAHDVHQHTIQTMLPGFISALKQRGLRGVTLAECLGLSLTSAYAGPRGSTSTTTTATGTTQTTATTGTATTGTATTATTGTATTGTTGTTGTATTGTTGTATTGTTGTATTGTATTGTTGTATTGTATTGTATTGTTGTATTGTTGTATTATTGTATTGTATTGTTKTTATTATGTKTTATGTKTTATGTKTTATGTKTTGTKTATTGKATATGYPVSTNWQCGASAGTRCPAGNCCSRYGWCGDTREYCKAGCQNAFGICR